MVILFLFSFISSNLVIGAVGINLDVLLGTYDCTRAGDVYPVTTGTPCSKYVVCSDNGNVEEVTCDQESVFCAVSPGATNCRYNCPLTGLATVVFTSAQGTKSPYYGLCYKGEVVLQRICRPQGNFTTVFDLSSRECIPSCTADSPNRGDECGTSYLRCLNNVYVKVQCPPDFVYSAAQNGCWITCNGTSQGPNNFDNTTIKPSVPSPVTPSKPTNRINGKTTPRRF